MGALIDTSIIVAGERRGVSVDDLLHGVGVAASEPVALAAISAAELFLGVQLADDAHATARAAFVTRLLSRWPVIPFDVAEADALARLLAHFRRIGRHIGAHDAQIAATALVRNWPVATLNRRDFERVPGLRVLAPPPELAS